MKKRLTPRKNILTVMRQNVLQVLLKSNVMPFRWLRTSYRCFYCYEVLVEPKDLKEHNKIHTNDNEKEKAMNNYWEDTVNVDFTNIACNICLKPINDLEQLIDHLITKHDVLYDKDIGVCIKPFKLNDISVDCLECGSRFPNFGQLLVHSRTHSERPSPRALEATPAAAVLCDLCGTYFQSKGCLSKHIQQKHADKPFKCPKCDVIIPKRCVLRTHMQNYHNKRYKCRFCPESFPTHYRRSQHVMNVHKLRDSFTCPQCPATYVFESTMKRHLREKHYKEKNAVCPVCGWQSFNSSKLRMHMYKHSTERNFSCPVCPKTYKAKVHMHRHMRRAHGNSDNVLGITSTVAVNADQKT